MRLFLDVILRDCSNALHQCYTVLLITVYGLLFLHLQSGVINAGTLSLETVLAKAKANSHDLKIAQTDIEISTFKIDEARSLYYPALSARLANEYLHDLATGTEGFASVGDQILNSSNSTYQHSAGINLSYDVIDFGVRERRFRYVKKELELSRSAYMEQSVRLKTEVLDRYTESLTLSRDIAANRKILALREEIYQLIADLYKAGTEDRIRLSAAAVEVAETTIALKNLTMKYQSSLNALSTYTGETYSYATTDFDSLTLPTGTRAETEPDVRSMPEIISYDIEIVKKEQEAEIIRRQRLPKVVFYSSYRLYGNDPASFSDSFSNLSSRNVTVGAVVDLKIFEGFAGLAREKIIKGEIKKLKQQREKKITELSEKIATLTDQAEMYEQSSDNWRDFLDDTAEKDDLSHKLRSQKETDRITLLNQMIETLANRHEAEKNSIKQAANSLRLQILAENTI